ncbi:hypothetical protein GYMLUDRAFT_252895 [Collybiopsis luxurians FD-317 M1]|uniref:Uncharacterized protein n=1 Tax=Collybiopsis luxurians FD-317 M1 TaxID=944289 RepID=A0A0D0AK52_9AGAR|nr:hypothetical protein GYMLUDRAFT_252895 [Collybiopsis luxurians FD-317 M1]
MSKSATPPEKFALQDQRHSSHFHDHAQDNHKEFAKGGTLNTQHANFGDTTYGGTTTYQPGSFDQRGALNVRNDGLSDMNDHYTMGYAPYNESNARRSYPQENPGQAWVAEPHLLPSGESQLQKRFVRCIQIDPHPTDVQKKLNNQLIEKFQAYMGLNEREVEAHDGLIEALELYMQEHKETGSVQLREQAFKALRAYLHRENGKNLEGALNACGKWEPGLGEVGGTSGDQK